QDPKSQRQNNDHWEEVSQHHRLEDQSDAADNCNPEEREVGQVLQRVSNRSLWNPLDFLELSRSHKTARTRQVSKNDLGDYRGHAEGRKVRDVFLEREVVLCGSDETRCKAAERVRQGGSLGNSGQRDLG